MTIGRMILLYFLIGTIIVAIDFSRDEVCKGIINGLDSGVKRGSGGLVSFNDLPDFYKNLSYILSIVMYIVIWPVFVYYNVRLLFEKIKYRLWLRKCIRSIKKFAKEQERKKR